MDTRRVSKTCGKNNNNNNNNVRQDKQADVHTRTRARRRGAQWNPPPESICFQAVFNFIRFLSPKTTQT